MAIKSLKPVSQLHGIFSAVIYSCNKTVFKSDPASCFPEIMSASFQKFIYGIFIGNRHKFTSFFIIWRMQGNSKRHLKFFFSQLIDFRYKPAGRNCKISLTDMNASVFSQYMDESQKVIVIIQWFSCSHHNNIGNPLACRNLYSVNLIQHF